MYDKSEGRKRVPEFKKFTDKGDSSCLLVGCVRWYFKFCGLHPSLFNDDSTMSVKK